MKKLISIMAMVAAVLFGVFGLIALLDGSYGWGIGWSLIGYLLYKRNSGSRKQSSEIPNQISPGEGATIGTVEKIAAEMIGIDDPEQMKKSRFPRWANILAAVFIVIITIIVGLTELSDFSDGVTDLSVANIIDQGIEYHDQGEYELAIAEYDKAINKDPANPDAYNNRGVSNIELG